MNSTTVNQTDKQDLLADKILFFYCIRKNERLLYGSLSLYWRRTESEIPFHVMSDNNTDDIRRKLNIIIAYYIPVLAGHLQFLAGFR